MEKTYYIILMGTAGSGKTTLAHALGEWLTSQGVDCARINLDPAVEWLPYTPDVDVRDYVNAHEVALKHNLGPNGALLASVDLLINYVDDLRTEMSKYKGFYNIIDTPGQLELFAYRPTPLRVIGELVNPATTVAVFLIDSVFAASLASLASLILLATSVQLRHGYPQVNVVSKSDLLGEEGIRLIEAVNENPLMLIDAMREEASGFTAYVSKLYEAIADEGVNLIPVSSYTEEGLAGLFGEIQSALGTEEGIESNI